jgi:predicted acetyltransferase
VRNIAAVTQAAAHASCKQNGDEELQVQSFGPDARAANLQNHARRRCFGIVARPSSARQATSYIMKSNRGSSGSVQLTAAMPAQEPILQNLMQLYTHDFSEFWAGTARGDLDPDGRFEAYPLREYWSRPNWSALFIWRNQILAGFSLVNDNTHSGLAAIRNVGEFFILRKHRGQGVGRRIGRTQRGMERAHLPVRMALT